MADSTVNILNEVIPPEFLELLEALEGPLRELGLVDLVEEDSPSDVEDGYTKSLEDKIELLSGQLRARHKELNIIIDQKGSANDLLKQAINTINALEEKDKEKALGTPQERAVQFLDDLLDDLNWDAGSQNVWDAASAALNFKPDMSGYDCGNLDGGEVMDDLPDIITAQLVELITSELLKDEED